MSIFVELSLIVLVATGLSLLMKLLKQPLVVGYILSGIVAGPLVFDLIASEETLELFSKMGITTLLFIIGLHLNPKVVREVGGVAVVTGLGQIIFTSVGGYLVASALGFEPLSAWLIATAMTFSSTIIILKLLADKNDLDSLYGKVSTGFLLVQDIVASLILLSIALFAKTGSGDLLESVASVLLMAVGVLLVLFVVSKYVLPYVVRFAASQQELLFVFCLAWGMGVASVFDMVGLSIEIGALLAGVALSATAYAYEISSRLRPLRDFFILLFFILLGSQMQIGDVGSLWVAASVLSVFVLVGNPLIVFVLMNLLGYHKRTSFLAGLTVAQISEFSLILVKLGRDLGYLDQQVVSLVTLVGLVTIALSTYMIMYSKRLYEILLPVLEVLSLRKPKKMSGQGRELYDAILFGHGRVGRDYIRAFTKMELSFLVVDFDPKVIAQLEDEGVPCVYGDADDVEFLSDLPLSKVKLFVSTISDYETDLVLVRELRKSNKQAVVVVKTGNVGNAMDLYEAGASYVIMPHYLGAAYAQRMIRRNGVKSSLYEKARKKHLAYLEKRVV